MIAAAFNPARGIEAYDELHARLCAQFGGRCWTMQNDVAGAGGVRELTGQSPGTASATGVTLNAPGHALYGEPGRAAAFDGVAVIILPAQPPFLSQQNQPLSFSSWVYSPTLQTRYVIGAQSTVPSAGWGLRILNTGAIRHTLYGVSDRETGANAYAAEQWFHLVFTLSANTLTFYVNGVAVTQTTVPNAGIVTAQSFPLGGFIANGAVNSRFLGSLAYAMILPAALDQSHVTTLYREGAQI